MRQMEGRVALITEAARGQRRSHALRLARGRRHHRDRHLLRHPDGALPDGTSAELAETAKAVEQLRRRCLTFKADARNADAMNDAASAGLGEIGRLDPVVINHGINLPHSVEDDNAVAVWETVVGVNFSSAWYTAAACVSSPARRRRIHHHHRLGCVVDRVLRQRRIHRGQARLDPAGALALDLAQYWIRVNAVCPGNVPTALALNPHV